jgi:hypothetical protein
MQSDRRYWFRAKRYGWGWGLPVTWQGWLVLAVFVGLLIGGSVVLSPGRQPGLYFAYVVALSAVLVAVCWLTGEPPRWRWGGDRGE